MLASASPRRRELLRSVGLAFEVRVPAIEERHEPGESPEEYVRRLSSHKAAAVGGPGDLVLAADTVVVLDEEILEKPVDSVDATNMLRRLSGREHRVLTGVTLRGVETPQEATEVSESRVEIRPLSDEEIAWYVATGEPDDKAGGYALQGLGGLFVERISGSSSNVIGLPLPTVYRLFERLGLDLKRWIDGGRAATGT